MNTLFRILPIAIASAWLMSPANAETVERSSAADVRGEVEISNVSGSVRVTGWDRAEVQVNGELGKDVERLDVVRDSEHILVKVVLRKGHQHDTDAELTIRIPRDSRLVIDTVSADQVIEDVRGVQRLQSVSGDIRAQVWGGEFEAKTVSGSITAKGQTAKSQSEKGQSEKSQSAIGPTEQPNERVHVTSVSGSIELDNLGSDLDVDSVSGEIEVRAQTLSRARIKTVNGSLQLSSMLSRNARIDAETINGELSLTISGVVDAEFDIETFNGGISNCFGPKAKKKSEYGPGSELRFKEGEGSAAVRVKTLNGKVKLCRTQKTAWLPIEYRMLG
jgi:DUF4097 and DUF4098 domain-containing protein YvlB